MIQLPNRAHLRRTAIGRMPLASHLVAGTVASLSRTFHFVRLPVLAKCLDQLLPPGLKSKLKEESGFACAIGMRAVEEIAGDLSSRSTTILPALGNFTWVHIRPPTISTTS
jgi:hypothetical protein